MSFQVGDYVAFSETKQISLVVDRATHSKDNTISYRTRIIIGRLGEVYGRDSQEQTWHNLNPKNVRTLSQLEIELL